MQHHAGPTSAEHDIELAGRGGNRFEIDQCLAHGVLNGTLPLAGFDEALVAFAHQWVQVQRIGVFGRDLGCAAGLKRNDGKTQTQAAQQPRIEGGSKAGRSHLG